MAALLLASSVLTPALSATPVAAAAQGGSVTPTGEAHLAALDSAPGVGLDDPEFATTPDAGREGASGRDIHLRSFPYQPAEASAASAAAAPQQATRTPPRVKKSFDGLNFRQQRLANGGNQFSVEPPDQGMCVGNGLVLESTNDVIRLFDSNGAPLTGVVDLNTFYGYPAQFDRSTGMQGPFVTDPSCWFDADTNRWFHLVLTLEVFPDTGDFMGANHLDLAVSRTGDPRGGFVVYRFDVTDDGLNGTPNHHCPPGPPPGAGHHAPSRPNACIGDFPHIGADKFSVSLTTNEYCLFCAGIGFHAAQVYTLSKQALASSLPVAFQQLDTLGMQAGKPGFTLWPATSPTTADFELRSGGTQYFTSSNAAEEVSGVPNSNGTNRSDEIVVWTLSNTRSVTSATPNVRLRNATVKVSPYAVPDPSNQKPGPFPLGQCINDTTTPTIFGTVGCWTVIFATEPKHNEVEGPLDSSDTRVLSTSFARGLLYGTLDTTVRVGGQTKAGVLWYIINPRGENRDEDNNANDNDPENGAFHGKGSRPVLVRQGHIAPHRNNALYGTVAATHTGRAIVGFTLVGDTHYPSAAYVSLNGRASEADIQVIAEGLGPQDGFTEYNALSGSGTARPRWGDYGASVAADDNTIWLANEYIAQTCTLAQYMSAPFGSCGGTRGTLGNWATRISAIDVSP